MNEARYLSERDVQERRDDLVAVLRRVLPRGGLAIRDVGVVMTRPDRRHYDFTIRITTQSPVEALIDSTP